ncbi:nuclear transport factor 2 family protein [Sphingobium phenoxybenzoativorans]|uniref:nuclear transport factor 2 family protein n=1 Tax=Sphingobium phenoxybenzoativorans TaxID=1592790 RepID=UPI00087205D4|nr:nuclear transport factor 2 family protein [Sphingobium phenoxybenzoativorans]
MNTADVINAFYSRIAARDFVGVIDLYDDDIRIWQSHNEHVQSKSENIPHLEYVAGRTNIRHEIVDRVIAEDKGSVRCRVHMDLPDGQHFEFPVAIFFTVRAGHILSIHEYVDNSVVARLTEALSPPAEAGA